MKRRGLSALSVVLVVLAIAAGRATALPYDGPLDSQVVASSAGVVLADRTPPMLIGLDILPLAVDTSSGPKVIVVSLHITDDLSGVFDGSLAAAQACVGPPPPQPFVSFDGPAPKTFAFSTSWQFVSGSPLDAIFQLTVPFPANS